MDESLSIAKFDPMVAELQALVEGTKAIVSVDHSNPDEIKNITAKRKEIRDKRKEIEDFGKSLRAGALSFQKAVIAKENEIVAIIEPEEKRLKGLEDEAKEKVEMESRAALLPARREKLAMLCDGIEASDEELLKLDPEEFTAYYNQRVGDKNAKDQAEIAKKQAEVDRKQAEMDRKEREAKIAEDARLRGIEEAKKAEETRREEEKKHAEQEAERKEIEAKQIADKEAKKKKDLEKQARYQAWLLDNEYEDNGEFLISDLGAEVFLYKKVSTFTK